MRVVHIVVNKVLEDPAQNSLLGHIPVPRTMHNIYRGKAEPTSSTHGGRENAKAREDLPEDFCTKRGSTTSLPSTRKPWWKGHTFHSVAIINLAKRYLPGGDC